MDEFNKIYEREQEDKSLWKKIQKDPMVPLGLVGIATILVMGARGYSKRNVKTSLYLINLRLLAQGTFLGCVSVGLVYSMVKRHFYTDSSKEK